MWATTGAIHWKHGQLKKRVKIMNVFVAQKEFFQVVPSYEKIFSLDPETLSMVIETLRPVPIPGTMVE